MKYYVENIDKVIKDIEIKSWKALMKCWKYLEWKLREEVGKDSYDTGKLAGSIETIQESNEKVVVWTKLEYALVREYWRRPWKFPPLDALVGRSARKGMISWWATSRYDDLHYKDKGVVFVIARAIARRGIEGKHTFETVINREIENISNLFVKYMQQW